MNAINDCLIEKIELNND